MTDYKATPEQWAQIERSQVFNGSFQACVLELRARVEALEANSNPTPNDRQIRSLLVERVASAIGRDDEPVNWRPEARAAIREVAALLRDRGGYPDAWMAKMLDKEAER
jgi:hypothetical protein